MFFRSPSQNANNEYFPQNEPIFENTQRVIFNNSFTVHQRPGIQEKIFQNFQHQTLNPHLNIAVRTDQNKMVEESRQRPVSFYKSPRHEHTTITRGNSYVESSQIPIQHQFMILRNERAQMSEKMRRIEEELFHRDNIIKIREKEILELKHANSQPMIFKTNSFDKFPQFLPQKQKIDYQTADLKEKIENIQRQNNLLSMKYQQLLSQSKSSFDTGRRIKREQSQQQISLIKSQRSNRQLEKQVFDLKQKVKELEDQNSKNSTQSSVFNYSFNNFQEQLGASRSMSNKDSHSSNFELQKLQNQIKQKNEMIKYLQVQCLRQSQAKGSEQEYHKVNRQSEQSKKEIAYLKKQLEILKFENESWTQKITKSGNQTEQLRRKNRTLEFLISELKQEIQSAKNKGQIQKETYESKIQQLSWLLAQNSSNVCKQSNQMELGIKKYEVVLSQIKTKSAIQLSMKDKIIKEQQQQKQKLIDKMADYQLEIKNKNLRICTLEDQISKAKFNEQFRKLSEKKIPDQNIQNIQTQLKAQSNKVSQLQLAKKIVEEQCGNIKVKWQKEVQNLKQMLIVSEEKQKVCEQSLFQTKQKFTTIIKAYQQKEQMNCQKQKKYLQIRKVHEQEKQRLMDELNKQKQRISGLVNSEQNLKKEVDILNEKIKQKQSEIQLKGQNGNQVQFESAKLLQKVRELTDFVEILKSSIQTKQKQMAKLQQKIEMNSKLSQMIVGFQSKLKHKDQQIERMIAENNKRDQQRELLEIQKQESSQKQGLKMSQKQQIVEQMSNQIQNLICDQKQKQVRIKLLESELQQKTRQSQIHLEHQNQLLALRTESIVQTQQIKAIRKILTTKQVTQNQYRNTLEQKLKSIFQLELQLKTVRQSLKAAVMQFQEYKQQQQLQLSTKQEAPVTQSLSTRSKAKSIKSFGDQEIFSDKGIDNESFIADFIEIDRNALLYICDLLNIVPSEGEVLKNIIEHIEQSPQTKCQKYYQQILELFGVETGFCEQTHMNLICSIKQYRMTISALIEKMDLLEERVESANKENRTLGKQLDFKNKENYLLEDMVAGLNRVILRTGVKKLSEKYGRTQSIEAKEIVGEIGSQ